MYTIFSPCVDVIITLIIVPVDSLQSDGDGWGRDGRGGEGKEEEQREEKRKEGKINITLAA